MHIGIRNGNDCSAFCEKMRDCVCYELENKTINMDCIMFFGLQPMFYYNQPILHCELKFL